MKPTCITFAGVPGSQKTPLGAFLSPELGWPVLEHDEIRYEVHADMLDPELDQKEFERRRDDRRIRLLERKQNFIYDASVDRQWPRLKGDLVEYGYRWFIISMNLSESFLDRLQQAGAKGESGEGRERWSREHREFLDKYSDDVGLVIDDETFPKRNELALTAVKKFLAN